MTLLASMRRHSIRVQHHMHRWSICGTDGGQLLSDAFAHLDIGMSGSSSCSSTSSDSALSTEAATPASVGPFTVVLLGDNGVGKSALASIFAGASDSMGSQCELYGGMLTITGLIYSLFSNFYRHMDVSLGVPLTLLIQV